MFRRNKFIQTLINNGGAKICSFVLACLFFLYGLYYSQDCRLVTIPVEVKLPSGGLHAASAIAPTVQVSIRGDGDVIYLVNPSDIHASVDFSHLTEGGIATAPVVLSYEREVFKEGSISLETKEATFRVLFEGGGE